MTRLLGLALVVVLMSVTAATPSAAVPPAGCLSTPLPTTVGSPSYSFYVVWSPEDQARADLWRQPCANNPAQAAILMRVTPITSGPYVCSAYFDLIQNGASFRGRISTSETGVPSFCDVVSMATTFVLTEGDSGPILNALNAFTLIHRGLIVGAQQLQVPAAGPTPTVTVVSAACNPCHSGQTVAFNMNISNPGPAMTVELKGGAHFPDGSILSLFNQVTTLPSGASVLTLVPAQALPGGLPTIDLLIEAAILEPHLGVTLSRQNVILHLLP